MSKLSKDYLLWTFSIMAVCWGILAVLSLNGIFFNDNILLYIPYMLGGWSPTIASYIVLKKNNQVNNFKDWLRNVFDLKHNVFSYIMVLIFAIIFILSQCLSSGYEKGVPFITIIALVPAMLFGGGLEEAGWRYIFQPELEKKCNFYLSTIIVSIIWWLWHLPLFYIEGIAQDGMNFWLFGIKVLGLSFALASIKKNTNSVWLCVLFHCLVNSLTKIYVVNDNLMGNLVTTIVLIVVSFIFTKINNNKKIFSLNYS